MESMVKVMASGVFDLLHIGHLHYLEEARSLGDELVVVIANDETVRKSKHEPIFNQGLRAELVSSLKPVDHVVIGGVGDPFETVIQVRPDVICLGYDQSLDPESIEKELEMRGLEARVVRCKQYDSDLNGTRKVIRQVLDRRDTLYEKDRDR